MDFTRSQAKCRVRGEIPTETRDFDNGLTDQINFIPQMRWQIIEC